MKRKRQFVKIFGGADYATYIMCFSYGDFSNWADGYQWLCRGK